MLGEVGGLRFARCRLTLRSGHATSPAWGSLVGEGAWGARSPRLLLGWGRLGNDEGVHVRG